jgi:serine/threonine protein phosphatase 1
MQRIFIVGDIHGCSKTFKHLVTESIKLKKSDKLYCLGDYIDRGNDSKGVIDLILQMRKNNYQVHTLRGNHEQMLLESMTNDKSLEHWLKNGGQETLNSFKIKSLAKLNPVYLDFIKRTKFFIKTKDFILVHAGLNFTIGNPLADKDALLWIRNFNVDKNYLEGKILIHGHTPKSREIIISQKFESPINIDGGCVYKHISGYGSLFALNYYERKLIEVKNID